MKFFYISIQPSDKTCLCEKGYKVFEGREQDCAKKLYDICGEGEWRSQEGLCLNENQWIDYCSVKVGFSFSLFLFLVKIYLLTRKANLALKNIWLCLFISQLNFIV